MELSDYEEVKLTTAQFNEWHKLANARLNALWRIVEVVVELKDSQREALEFASADLTKWSAIQNETIKAGFVSVVEALTATTLPPPQPKQVEVKIMFIVKDDQAPVNFTVALGDVTDAEGNTIPDAQVDLEVLSSDDSVLSLSFDPATRSGVVSFGNPGVASLTAKVSSGGNLLGSGAADFTVTVGDPAAISNVALNFDGLTEA